MRLSIISHHVAANHVVDCPIRTTSTNCCSSSKQRSDRPTIVRLGQPGPARDSPSVPRSGLTVEEEHRKVSQSTGPWRLCRRPSAVPSSDPMVTSEVTAPCGCNGLPRCSMEPTDLTLASPAAPSSTPFPMQTGRPSAPANQQQLSLCSRSLLPSPNPLLSPLCIIPPSIPPLALRPPPRPRSLPVPRAAPVGLPSGLLITLAFHSTVSLFRPVA
jgi:hypothetical protein